MQNVIKYILILGAFQGILLSVFLWTKKENRIANILLGFALFGYAIDILNTLFVYSETYLEYPFFIGMFALMPFLYAPSIYLYAKVLGKNEGEKFPTKYYLHFMPLFIIQVISLVYLLFSSIDFKLSLMSATADKPFITVIIASLIPFYGIAYIGFAIREAIIFNRKIRDNYSDIEKIKINWLFYLLIGIAITWILELIQYIVTEGLTVSNMPMYLLIYIFISVIIYATAFFALKLPQVFISEKKGNKIQDSYVKSGLSSDKAALILENLQKYMKENQPFLRSELKANELAEAIGISIHNLSEVLNNNLNKSFYEFVNEYRVEKVKNLIQKDQQRSYTLLAHALEAGFSSKSSFNTIFKKYTGTTPSEFRELIQR